MSAKTPVIARCPCGETFRGGSLDRVNELLARHYKTCDGSAPVRKRGGAAGK